MRRYYGILSIENERPAIIDRHLGIRPIDPDTAYTVISFSNQPTRDRCATLVDEHFGYRIWKIQRKQLRKSEIKGAIRINELPEFMHWLSAESPLDSNDEMSDAEYYDALAEQFYGEDDAK